MDKTAFLEFISIVVTGSLLSVIFPEGKYKNLLKMLLSAIIFVSVFPLFFVDFPEASLDFPNSSSVENYGDKGEFEEDGLKNVIISLAKNDAEKLLYNNFGIEAEEIEFFVVEYNNDYYIDRVEITVFSYPSDLDRIREAFSEYFGIPKINVGIYEGIKEK